MLTRAKLKFRAPPNLKLMHSPVAKNLEIPLLHLVRKVPEGKASVDADVAVVVDEVGVDEVANKRSRRRSHPQPQTALFLICPGRKLGLKKMRRQKGHRKQH
jgi:hypothetical protein